MIRGNVVAPHLNGKYNSMDIIIEKDIHSNIGALWLGDRNAARDKQLLKSKGIKSVLTVASELFLSYNELSGIYHQKFDIHDNDQQNLSEVWGKVKEKIDERRKYGGVLIHCAMGVSRSASLVIAYLMLTTSKPFLEAYNYVKHKRSTINPNPNFRAQLQELDKELFGFQQIQQVQEVQFKQEQTQNTSPYFTQNQNPKAGSYHIQMGRKQAQKSSSTKEQDKLEISIRKQKESALRAIMKIKSK